MDSATIGDLDADGRSELLVFTRSAGWALLIEEVGRFGDARTITEIELSDLRATTAAPQSAPSPRWAAADVDEDGLVDLACHFEGAVHLYRASGDGSFESRRVIARGADADGRLEFVDLDRDGRTDIFVDGFQVALRRPDGTFPPLRDYRSAIGGTMSVIADIDGDGALDVISGIGSPPTLLITPGIGRGGFGAIETLDSGGIPPGRPVVADFDGDGRLDLAHLARFGERDDATIRVWRTAADGRLERVRDLLDPRLPRPAFVAIAAADADGDGPAEIFASTADGRLLTFRGDPEGPRPAYEAAFAPRSSRHLFVDHLAGDGALDLIVAGESGVFVGEGAFEVIENATGQIRGDCDQDGRLLISDAICILGVLSLSTPARFPCGDGSPHDPATVAPLDTQSDQTVDLSDAVRVLQYLFLGGPPVGDGQCVDIDGCAQGFECRG